jgi:hypothetical protein
MGGIGEKVIKILLHHLLLQCLATVQGGLQQHHRGLLIDKRPMVPTCDLGVTQLSVGAHGGEPFI